MCVVMTRNEPHNHLNWALKLEYHAESELILKLTRLTLKIPEIKYRHVSYLKETIPETGFSPELR
jgi:hypothetical protein